MIIRTKRWHVLHFTAWGVPLGLLYFNRFAELLLHKPGEGILLSILATLLSPLRWGISKFMESYCKSVIPIKKHGMVPNHSFFDGIASCLIAKLPANFYDNVERGSIVLKNTKAFEFCKEGVIIEGDPEPIRADLVIFCTGFKGDQKLKDIFAPSPMKEILADSLKMTVPLYRHIIHPRIPQMAVIGYSDTMAGLHSTEMRSRWLTHFLDGGFRLPNIRAMENDVMEWEKHSKRYSRYAFLRPCLSSISVWYRDQLCKDMGCKPNRKKGFFANLFLP